MDERFHRNALFAGLPSEELNALKIPIEIVRCEADEIICEEGDAGDCLFLVAEGAVQISKKGRGGQQEPLSLQAENGFFGEMAALDNQPRSARATAVAPTVLGRMNRAGLYKLLGASPDVALQFVRLMARRLRSSSSLFIEELVHSERLSLVGTMMSSIVHDIRNPIATITLATDYLASQGDNPAAQQMASVMRDATDQMLNMIQELLDFAKGSSTVNLKETTVAELLRVLDGQMLKTLEDEGRIEVRRAVTYDGPITVDAPRIVRLLINVIKNAAEAMPGKGTLSLKVGEEGEYVAIEITDSGCGIPPDVLSRIFDPFVTHGKSGGTGLGMAIAKSVVEAHRGRITVESEEGRGTTCRILLPL